MPILEGRRSRQQDEVGTVSCKSLFFPLDSWGPESLPTASGVQLKPIHQLPPAASSSDYQGGPQGAQVWLDSGKGKDRHPSPVGFLPENHLLLLQTANATSKEMPQAQEGEITQETKAEDHLIRPDIG